MPCEVRINLSEFPKKDPRSKIISVMGVVLEHDKTYTVADNVAAEIVAMKIGTVLSGTPEKMKPEFYNRMDVQELTKRREFALDQLPTVSDDLRALMNSKKEEDIIARIADLEPIGPYALIVLHYKGHMLACKALLDRLIVRAV